MANKIEKPKRSTKKVFVYILAVTIVIFIVFLGYMAIRENHRHTQLERGIDALQTALKEQGIETQKTSGCGRPYSEIGQGAKHCAIGIDTKTGLESEYVHAITAFSNTLSNSKYFSATSSPLAIPTSRSDMAYGSAAYINDQTGKSCGALYQHEDSTSLYDVQFSCDDTSWFVRTFEN